MAALAAERGVTGALDVLEGPAGFGAAMSTGADWSRATAELGTRYNITAMTAKNHGCCGHSFAAIDAALALQAEHRIRSDEIARITVGGYRATVEVTGRKSVATPFEGRFSTPFTVATALIHGSVRLAAFEPERLADPNVQALMRRVDVVLDPQCEADFPGRRSAVVEIEMQDGRRLRRYQPHRKGDPEEPLTDAELTGKFFELASPVMGRPAADLLLAALWTLDRQPHVRFAVEEGRALPLDPAKGGALRTLHPERPSREGADGAVATSETAPSLDGRLSNGSQRLCLWWGSRGQSPPPYAAGTVSSIRTRGRHDDANPPFGRFCASR